LGGSLHPRLNTDEIPIAKKYREGKMKSTSKGELKEPEIVGREAFGHPSSRSFGLLQRSWFHSSGVVSRLRLGDFKVRGSSLRQWVSKRPVLKHGPRSLAHVQV
jgi:hypothetical protein